MDLVLPPDTIDPAPPPGFVPRPMRGGFLLALGPLYLRPDPAGGPTTYGLRVQPRHCNAKDMAHGGLLTGVADTVLGLSGFEQAGVRGYFITISLTTDFVAPAPLGAWLECRPELVRATRSLVFAQGVFAADGTPALRASGVFRVPPQGAG
ncbi:MAG: PaaI family thioesterase [Acetobacteraceae bacterium]|nr:PaaI family thioesterase [Acetobacteraceae bacterium]